MTALFLVLVVVSLALVEAAYHGMRYLGERKDEELKRRLRAIGTADAGVQVLRRRRIAASAFLEELLGGWAPALRIERLLEQTDVEWSVAAFLGYTALAAACGTIGLGMVTRAHPAAMLLGAALGALPLLSLYRARARRSTRISDQLPDSLEMMSRSIRAGHSLPASFKLVAQEMPSPIAVEFGMAFEQQNLGLPFDEAVMAMTARVPGNADLGIFGVSVLIQRETGGNLVEMLEQIAETVRERYRFYGKLRALTAEGRMGGLILGSLPFVVGALLTVVNPSYMSELAGGLGRMILVGGLVSWAVGIVWMHRIAQVDY